MPKKLASSIHDFQLLKEIGRGGYSIVYRALHKNSGKIYALKAVNKIIDGNDKTKRVKREINVLIQLDHPNIIKLYDWFESTDKIYLILEYIECTDLYHHFRSATPDETTSIHIIRQIALALKYCHDNGIIHRDIKPHNVLVDNNLNVKLSDFGLCVVKLNVGDLFKTNAGTHKYKAPEIINRVGYNESIDIWSFGILIYYFLTGKYPFNGSNQKKIEQRILSGKFSTKKTCLSVAQISLLKNMLVLNPCTRYTIINVLNHPWLKIKEPLVSNDSNCMKCNLYLEQK